VPLKLSILTSASPSPVVASRSVPGPYSSERAALPKSLLMLPLNVSTRKRADAFAGTARSTVPLRELISIRAPGSRLAQIPMSPETASNSALDRLPLTSISPETASTETLPEMPSISTSPLTASTSISLVPLALIRTSPETAPASTLSESVSMVMSPLTDSARASPRMPVISTSALRLSI